MGVVVGAVDDVKPSRLVDLRIRRWIVKGITLGRGRPTFGSRCVSQRPL